MFIKIYIQFRELKDVYKTIHIFPTKKGLFSLFSKKNVTHEQETKTHFCLREFFFQC